MRAPVTQQKRQTSKKDEHHALHSTRSTHFLSLVVPVLRSLSESCFASTELIAVNTRTIAAYLYIPVHARTYYAYDGNLILESY
jgi:hypothetical protein